MAHSEPLVIIQQQQEDGGTTTVTDHERTPLLITSTDKVANRKKNMLSRLKDRAFVKSKAANMILLWNLLVSLLYGILLNPGISIAGISNNDTNILEMTVGPTVYGFVAICLLFYPLAGYLGDVRFGRYKTVCCSLWTIWIALLTGPLVVGIFSLFFLGIISPAAGYLPGISIAWIVCIGVTGGVAFIAIIVGFAAFRANVIQFGMDQLQDSPARDSSLFIFWFLGTLYTGIGLGKIAWSSMINITCFPFLIAIICATVLIFLLAMPISLCVGHCKRRWFVLDPGMGNPYKQVRRVASFARKHKIPVQRSAFTYWEDDIPSGLDLGKNKYGGPFTTEQVEDVKAFFGILKVLLSLGPFFIVNFAATESLSILGSHMASRLPDSIFSFCQDFDSVLIKFNDGTTYPLLIVLMILFYTLLPQHYVQKYTPGMLKRIGIGLCLITVSLICSFTMDTAGHIGNHNVPCLFGPSAYYNFSTDSFVIETLDISPYYLLIQNILTAVAYIMIYGGTFEFICAQSPHSMKGFLIGVFFAVNGLFQLLGVLGIFLPFNVTFYLQNVYPTIRTYSFPSCGFSYYLVNIIISIVGVIAFTYAAKKYQYRQRDEFCDERRYIEEFYENAVNHNPKDDTVDV